MRSTLVLLMLLCSAAPALAVEAWRPFAVDSPFNRTIATDAAVDADPNGYVDGLNRLVERDIASKRGPWINLSGCTMPMYRAAANTPKVRVTLANNDPELASAWSAVPIPAEAAAAACSDKNFAVYQASTDRLWEFWSATRAADGSWKARWGGATDHASRDRGIASTAAWPTAYNWGNMRNWNVTASSVSMIGGVITADDVRSGSIDHALSIALPTAKAGVWRWPAQRTDGDSTAKGAVPEGSIFRIDPAVDVEAISAPPMVKMMMRAAQRHGIVVRDMTHHNVSFYVDSKNANDKAVFSAALDRKYPSAALKNFPWRRLQLLPAKECTDKRSACVRPSVARLTAAARAQVGSPVVISNAASDLDQPRAAVRYDLDGDGVYETAAGTKLEQVWVPTRAGKQRVGVEIVQRGRGTVAPVVASLEVDVAPANRPRSAPTLSSVRSFYAWQTDAPLRFQRASRETLRWKLDKAAQIRLRLDHCTDTCVRVGGTIVHDAEAGVGEAIFGGRFGNRVLPVLGYYRFHVTARDDAGRYSQTFTTSRFRLLPHK